MFKSYSSKSAALKGAKRAGFEADVVFFKDGQWGFLQEPVTEDTIAASGNMVEVPVESKPEPTPDSNGVTDFEIHGQTNCPHCDIHLSNGIGLHGDEVNGKVIEHTEKQYACLACGGEFGAPIQPKGTGLKIEKDRPESHGVKRPSAGGLCRAVWDFCEGILESTGTMPTAKQVKAQAAEAGWNVNNASIEYYNWRKFKGVRGRQLAPVKEAPATQA